MASAVKNTFMASGTRGPRSCSTARAKAMSVAMGMPQPPAVGVPRFSREKSRAGTSIPPRALARGKAGWRTDASSPLSTSRLISRPTIRKKMTISPSLIQCSRLLSRTMLNTEMRRCSSHTPGK